MLKVVLKAVIDRGGWGSIHDKPDPEPDTITLTTVDPNLEDLLTMFERFISGMGFYPPEGHLDYVEDPKEDPDGVH